MSEPPPLNRDWAIVCCSICHGDMDAWHRARLGHLSYTGSCRIDRWIDRVLRRRPT